jgi:hypothetical protein
MEEEERRLISNSDLQGQFGSPYNRGVQAMSNAPDNSMEGSKEVISFDKALSRAGGLGKILCLFISY